MAKFPRMLVLNEMFRIGVIPVFYHADAEVAIKIAIACAAGGARVIEFTNRGDQAYQVFCELNRYVSKEYPDIILGAGSIGDAATAALYIASGANFIVGPVLNPEVAKTCNRFKIPYSPGCGSATEIAQAEELGVELVKVFPGDAVGGSNFVKSILGPMSWSCIMPTGGVEATEESIKAWFLAGVKVVGIGSHLVKKTWVVNGEFEKITELTRQVIQWISDVRM